MVEVTATGERNGQAKSSEVWLIEPRAKDIRAESGGQAWATKYGVLVSYDKQPTTLRIPVNVNDYPTLKLATSPYSGIAVIRIGGREFREDLYSATQGVREIGLTRFHDGMIDFPASLLLFAWQYAAAVLIFFSLSWAIARTGSRVDRSSLPTYVLALLYAVPSLAVYFAVHLALWPGQLSPDSLYQWYQLRNGELSDAHPALTLALYGLTRMIHEGPALAVAVQYGFLALATGLFLAEMRRWSIRNGFVAALSCVVPLFPANFLIATTLWKDVLYAAALVLLGYGVIRLIRLRFQASWRDYLILGLAGLLLIGSRHNGILVIVPFFLTLLVFSPRGARVLPLSLLILNCTVFVLLKTVVLTTFNIAPIPAQYKAIVGAHVVGSMLAANASLTEAERKSLNGILPVQAWADSYQCTNVVPIFWHKQLSVPALIREALTVNRIALRLIATHPSVFIRHQLCVTRVIWQIRPEAGEWLPLAPLGVTDVDDYRSMGITMRSKVPALQQALSNLHEELGKSAAWMRPAAYLILACLAAIILSLTIHTRMWLAVAPAAFNVIGLVPIIGAPDFRYVWPSMMLSLLIIGFGFLVPKNPAGSSPAR